MVTKILDGWTGIKSQAGILNQTVKQLNDLEEDEE